MFGTHGGSTATTAIARGACLTHLTETLDAHSCPVGGKPYSSCPETAVVATLGVRMRIALAGVFSVVAVLFVVLGLAVSPLALGVALPFGVAAAVLWRQAIDRRARINPTATRGRRQRQRDARTRNRKRRKSPDRLSPAEARSVLEVAPEANQEAIRRAYRDRIKEVHPDRGGDAEQFDRVRQAYERLADVEEQDRREGF